jgi:ribosomal-protein-alanine N-acetyltransferase
MSLAIDFGLNKMELERIMAITTKQNTKAIRLMDRLKFRKVADLEGDDVEYELAS